MLIQANKFIGQSVFWAAPLFPRLFNRNIFVVLHGLDDVVPIIKQERVSIEVMRVGVVCPLDGLSCL
jgi:hypothetical protein